MNRDYSKLEENIGYAFNDKSLLELALMHKSYENEKQDVDRSNERLEFLGDAVISLVCAELLYKEFPELREGTLTRMRSSLVCTASLSKYAKVISLQDYLLLGKGEIKNFKFENHHYKLLEDTFEALMAAMYLDGSIDVVKCFLTKMMLDDIKHFDFSHLEEMVFHDYKSTLQNALQKENEQLPQYTVIKKTGPVHNSTFTVEVKIKNKVYGTGVGKSKKRAEQNAAKKALAVLENAKK
ncbi:MAG: ribonuclease III [Clostridiales bacterium]|nr:ribonuclease III [Clostridiales bacterium]